MPSIPRILLAAGALLLLAGAGIALAQTGGEPAAETAPEAAATAEPARPGRTGLALPRFVSLRAHEVNLRTGPGIRYPIEWVYRRRNLPVEIIDEFETWRRVRDWEGSVGWVHQSMLQSRRTVQVIGGERLLRREPDPGAAAVARLETGAIGSLEGCEGDWCRTNFGGFEGWLPRTAFYGVYPDEAGH